MTLDSHRSNDDSPEIASFRKELATWLEENLSDEVIRAGLEPLEDGDNF